MAAPPIQVWIPNQPHATMARSSAGTLAPSTPNDARANTGNGMPYLAPAWALSSIGTSTIRLPRKMVTIAWLQDIPESISPEARVYVVMQTDIPIHSAQYCQQ